MQKYVIIQLLEQVEDGTQFSMTEWPLHITLVSNFVIDKTVSELEGLLEDFCKNHLSVTTTVDEDDYFGPSSEVHVTKLEMNSNLMSIHMSLISLLKANGATFDDPQYIEEGYVAHATIQDDKKLEKGNDISITRLSLVDMFADNNIRERKILSTFNLQ